MNIKKYVETYKEQISELIAEFVAITLFFIPDIMFKVCINNYNHLTYEPLAMVFTMVLGIIVYAFLFAIFKTTFRATLISYIIIFLTFIINILKIIYTGEPIFFSDVSFLGKSIDLLQLVTGNISGNFILYLLKFVIPILIVFIPILILNYKFNLKIENKKERAIFIIIGVLIFLLLAFPTNYTKNLYSKLILKTDKIEDFDSFTTNLGFYVRNGFINGMYGTFLNNKFFMPDNYDEENLNRLLNETKQIKNTNSLGKPNIIIVFSESFWDIDQLDEIKFNKQITSNFNNLKNEGKFINLISPTYGGMSENVAFELVTGGSMNYFPKSYIPIMTLYSKAESKKNPSLIQILNNNGYNSEIIFGKDYYNSKKAYTNIGFNNYIDLSKENIKTESKISDEFMTDLLIKKLESKNGLGLYLMETIEAHMPYSVDNYEEYDVSLTESKLDENMNNTLRSYAQSIYNADKQLGRLYDYIKNYEEPTIILFLGDHLPYLNNSENQNVIDNLNYFKTEDELLNNYRLYNTQALLLANFNIDNFEIPEYLGPDLLLNYIINNMDIETNDYYKWLYNTGDILPASNRLVSLDKNGKIYKTSDLEEKMKNIYDLRELMQYKFFIKQNR